MKNNLLRLAAIVAILFGSYCALAFPPDTENNAFEITPIDNFHFGNSIAKAWALHYSNNEPLTIVLHSKGDVKEYIVKTNFFEITYALDENGFGVRKLHANKKKGFGKGNDSFFNKLEMEHQKVLSPNKVSDEFAVKLIASYLPDLLDQGYKHLIYK